MALFFRAIYLGWFISLIYAAVLYFSDKYRRESLINVGIAFTGGVAAIVIITTLHAGIPGFSGDGFTGGFLARAFDSFVKAAIPEEIAKLLVFFIIVWHFDFEDFSEGLDGMIYMGMIGAGFGAYEDFSYIFSQTLPYIGEEGGEAGRALQFITWQRAFPGHVLINSVSGYFLGRARFTNGNQKKFELVAWSLIVAILTHGLFNLAGSGGGTGWLIIYVLALGRVFFFLRGKMLEDSPYKAFSELPDEITESSFVSYINIIRDWEFDRPIDRYKKLYDRETSPNLGYLPVVISIVILYPVAIAGVYYLNKLILDFFKLVS
ncbi:MAG: PrsW family intramembrane metalloprotease [Candidatus Bipolaricaulota bacterium]|nr:PrsW family intramembrane metalloprotease [Candidatus Bipolaricaulota bacterium]MBS3792282.1 PrsW family intramembrane metalloprotease [Candidatus Bipolaricaulota bacterium]